MKNWKDNQTWIIDYGDEVIRRKATNTLEKLSSKDRLVYCLWVADYSMRNAGDLKSGLDLYPRFLEDGFELAKRMNLKKSIELFSQKHSGFEEHFFDLFNPVCDEIRNLI